MPAIPGNAIIMLPKGAVLCSHHICSIMKWDLTFDPRAKISIVNWI